ncbi:coiled-coil domain-containing protein [Flavivirga jejuensis]|uniref:Beta-carotene 15,15'-monooxygenase n=1 Tax=Flavivirga jejuensis TaxID=870487 RepID=A0ABT8WRC0_9FLAO|nr:beta-carotene 15,15'-monooxygenase [Flavivirga jejuensis]MDO5975709.1 beta-carotene 15,15'-monooxygenase [Flavivirga jejuensis]
MGFKNLIQLKPKEPLSKTNDEEVSQEVRKRTYHETGFRHSSRNMGNSQTLGICLDAVYAKFENEEKELNHKQEELKRPYFQEQRAKESEIKGFQVAIDNANENIKQKEDKNQDIKDSIKELRFEMTDLPLNPEVYGVPAKKGASAKFWIGLIVLIPITVYLFMFYASVVYSAMEKQFTYDDLRWYVPNAILLAAEDGFQALATVIFAPFIFIGLGYLIHMFYQKKKLISYFKLAGVVLATLAFDVLLAFFVEKKLWELNVVDENASFGFSEAMQSQEFWLIIFLGFIAYLIWGFIFDFVMEENKEKDKVKNAIRKRYEQIEIHQEQIHDNTVKIDELKSLIRTIKEKISAANGRIQELQSIIDGTIIPTAEYKLYASEYLQGWLTFIGEQLPIAKSEKDNLITACIDVNKLHLDAVGVRKDYQNTVFTKTL